MTDIVERLREWSAADMDTHASLRRNGAQVAEVPWSRHGTDLAETMMDAAVEIERLRAALAWQPIEEALGVSAVVCDGDETAPISRVYLADCRKCSRRVIAWLRGDDGEFGWGYAPIGECLNPARCGEKQPGLPA